MGAPWTWVLPALIAFVLTGGSAFLESIFAFTEALHVWRMAKVPLLLGSIVFGAWGVACYLGLLLLRADPIKLQFASAAPPEVVLAFAAFIVAQTGRIEGPSTTQMSGTPQIPGDRESYYGKGLRMMQAEMYRSLVDGIADKEVRLLVHRGLTVAYDLQAMMGAFRTWALNLADRAQGRRLVEWSNAVYEAKLRADAQKVDALVQRIIRDDLDMAKTLAKRRAPTIVHQRAL